MERDRQEQTTGKVASYPDTLSSDELGAGAEVNPAGGTFSAYLSDLRRAGLIITEGAGIRASELLMDPAAGGAR